jgi:HTH-type transcriptional regulator, transcriptional repressor of NAD biosynthesis genes
MRRGLVFGKFMPLHRGHQLLIDAALADSDDITIAVYDSDPSGDYPPMPMELRLDWLRRLYPNVEQIVPLADTWRHHPDRDTPEYGPLYAEELAFLGAFDRVYTSEPGYDTFAQTLGAQHVVVDAARTLVPISGTMIREAPFEHRGFMDPIVYASLVQKVALVGTESSGKSTLAKALAETFDTAWVHEFGRELWEAQNLEGTFADHLKTARRQHEREEAARRQARRYVFCDTNPWTTLQWSLRSYGTADARLFDLVEQTLDEYVWILCEPDFGWIQDGTREMDDGEALRFHEQHVDDLARRGVPFTTVSGPVPDRVESVRAVLEGVSAARPH